MNKPGKRKSRQVQRQSMSMRKLTLALSFAAIAGAVLFVMYNLGTSENALANQGKDGARTITSANTIVNEYAYLTSNVIASATQIQCNSNTLNTNSRFSGNLAAGDLLLIIQVQDALSPSSQSATRTCTIERFHRGFLQKHQIIVFRIFHSEAEIIFTHCMQPQQRIRDGQQVGIIFLHSAETFLVQMEKDFVFIFKIEINRGWTRFNQFSDLP